MEDANNARDAVGERRQIEEYLKLYCIEDLLDETINIIVEQRPINPYVEISKIMESKSMPEIIAVSIATTIIGGGSCGIEAIITTNLGDFKGSSSFPFDSYVEGSDFILDYGPTQEKITESFKNVDPRDVLKMDESLLKVAKDDNISPVIVLAVSIAATKAAARHKGVNVYKLISELTGTDACLPMPVPTILSRAGGVCATSWSATKSQQVLLVPTASDLTVAMESCIQAQHAITKAIKEANALVCPGTFGCHRLLVESLEKVIRIVDSSMKDQDFARTLRLAVDIQAGLMLKEGPIPPPEELAQYAFEGPGQFKSSLELAESIMALVRDYNVVSVEDPFHTSDQIALRSLREKMGRFIDECNKNDVLGEEHSYRLSGVGGQEVCTLQLVAATGCRTAKDMKTLSQEAMYNAFRVSLYKAGTVSKAIAMVKDVRDLGWVPLVGIDREYPETLDTFLTDFAVGVGAGQLLAGGLVTGEYSSKYSRLLEIARTDPNLLFVGRYFRR